MAMGLVTDRGLSGGCGSLKAADSACFVNTDPDLRGLEVEV